MFQIFFFFFFRIYSTEQIYLKAFQHSGCIKNPVKCLKQSIFSCDFLAVNDFRERTSSQKLDWVLNTPLILSSNVIWHAYKLIAENKIFRLGVSLIYLLYVKEEWIGKKSILHREFSGIFTINDYISGNSIQVNIKFAFTVYEFIIVYEYIILSNF